MSATSRGRPVVLPLKRGDYIIGMDKLDGHVLVTTHRGRLFCLTRVARYKRAFKVHELTARPDV